MSISIHHTLSFVKEFAATPETKILEVGCGDGSLALALQEYGYEVKAIDRSDISEFTSETKFDLVLFSQSLRSIRPLETVFNKVKTLLGERGRILVDEFSTETNCERTLGWYYEMKELLWTLTAKEIDPALEGEGPVERWKRAHHHEPSLHTAKDMLKVMERHFGNVHTAAVPYLYRTFETATAELPNGQAALQRLFDWELKQIERGLIQPVGLRIAAKKYFSYLR